MSSPPGKARSLAHSLERLIAWVKYKPHVLFAAWAFWLSSLYFVLGPASYVRVHDIGDSNLPARISASMGGALTDFWNRWAIAGGERLGQGLTSEIDILLFALLPGWLAYGLVMWLQRFVAGYFTYRLLGHQFGLGGLWATYAGLTYALFSQRAINGSWAGFTLYDGLALPGLPFLLWALMSIQQGQSRRSYVWAIGLGSLLSVTVHFALGIFILFVLVIWFLASAPRRHVRTWGLLASLLIGWVGFEFPVLWASLSQGPISHRANWDMSGSAFDQSRKLALAGNLIRGNIWPLMVALGGYLASRARDRRLWALLSGLFLALLFIGNYLTLYSALDQHLSFLSGFNFDRLYLAIPFLAAAAGGLGAQQLGHRLQTPQLEARTSRGNAVLCLFAGALLLTAVGQSISVQRRILEEMSLGSTFESLYAHPELKRLADNRLTSAPFRVATVYVPMGVRTQHPSFAWAYGLETADGYIPLYSQRYQDFWGQVISSVTDLDPAVHGYFHEWGSRVYLFTPGSRSRGALPQAPVDFDEYYSLELLSLANVRYVLSPVPLEDESLEPLPSGVPQEQLGGGRQEASSAGQGLGGLVVSDYPAFPIYIYENTAVMPRFFTVRQLIVYEDRSALLAALSEADRQRLASTAYLLQTDLKDEPPALVGGPGGEVLLEVYDSDLIRVVVNQERASILVATNNYDPSWMVSVNGEPSQLFPVDLTFQGVYVPAGRHEVVLAYRPPYLPRFIGK
jgi:hypothetical protein